jgi:hypothetical protein
MKRAIVASLVLLFAASGVYGSAAYPKTYTVDTDRDNHLPSFVEANKGVHGNSYTDTGGSTVLMSWDLSGISRAAGEYVSSVNLKMYMGDNGPSTFTGTVTAYPMLKTWVEGLGGDGTYGGVGFPWSPTSVGECTWSYQSVTTVGLGSGSFASCTVATGGTGWTGAGVTGADDRDGSKEMMNSPISMSGVSGQGTLAATLPLSATGCDVVEDWIDGDLTNYGMVVKIAGASGVFHFGTRESGCANAGEAPGASAPELEIEIMPEPGCMALLGMGTVLLFRRRKRK